MIICGFVFLNALIFKKIDVKSRVKGATPLWVLRRIFEMESKKIQLDAQEKFILIL